MHAEQSAIVASPESLEFFEGIGNSGRAELVGTLRQFMGSRELPLLSRFNREDQVQRPQKLLLTPVEIHFGCLALEIFAIHLSALFPILCDEVWDKLRCVCDLREVARVNAQHFRHKVLYFVALDRLVVHEGEGIGRQIQLPGDHADRIHFGRKPDLRTEEVLRQPEGPELGQSLGVISPAGDRMQNPACIQEFEAVSYATTKLDVGGLKKRTVPNGVIEIPDNAFYLVHAVSPQPVRHLR